MRLNLILAMKSAVPMSGASAAFNSVFVIQGVQKPSSGPSSAGPKFVFFSYKIETMLLQDDTYVVHRLLRYAGYDRQHANALLRSTALFQTHHQNQISRTQQTRHRTAKIFGTRVVCKGRLAAHNSSAGWIKTPYVRTYSMKNVFVRVRVFSSPSIYNCVGQQRTEGLLEYPLFCGFCASIVLKFYSRSILSGDLVRYQGLVRYHGITVSRAAVYLFL